MQLQGLMMMLFFMTAIPIIIISANHNVFFIFISAILAIASIRNIQVIITQIIFSGKNNEGIEEDNPSEDEMIEDLENSSNIDIINFSTGISVAMNLVVILFFIYCSFYLDNFLFKLVISLVILYRIYLSINLISQNGIEIITGSRVVTYSAKLIYILLSLFIIIATIYSKFLNII